MAEDIKKVPEEMSDEELGSVAGGVYSKTEWDAMTEAERKVAKSESIKLVYAGKRSECKFYN